jgi:hypothetical protein
MPIQPSQVVSRANSDLCAIELLLEARHRPSAERMAEIAIIAAGFSRAVEGSTTDPLRGRRA